jgi:cytochrome c peroxidase
MFSTAIRNAPRLAALRAPALRQVRALSTPAAAAKSSNTLLYGLIGAAAVGGGAFFAFAGKDDATTIKDAASPKEVNYQAVYNAIADVLDSEDYDDGSYGPVLVRLAWHCSGTFDKDSGNGGSNGATMRFAPESNHGANAGLDAARAKLEPIKAMFPQITYSDLWVSFISVLIGGEVPGS